MVKKDEIVRFVTDEETVAALDLLAEKTKTNRSMVIRELIPHWTTIEALAAYFALKGFNMRNLARDIALRYVCDVVFEEMRIDRVHDISLQRDIFCGGVDALEKEALLYTGWARAKMGTQGYKFEPILYHGKPRFTIVIGPGDTDAAVGALKKQIVEYAEKLRI